MKNNVLAVFLFVIGFIFLFGGGMVQAFTHTTYKEMLAISIILVGFFFMFLGLSKQEKKESP